ncbi:MAG: serine hydrolase [Gemmatimonadota bacterium]|nr:serine hydrolase [Gemmatimonadota bacterium]
MSLRTDSGNRAPGRRPFHGRAPVSLVLGALGLFACGPGEESVAVSSRPGDVDYAAVVAALTDLAEEERERWALPALSIALVDGERTVWSAGFGEERPGVPATGETVYRVGSVSKLFTDIGVMQLVEEGRLDLDVPVTTYLPDFRPRGDGAADISLRHLMSHRSGLVREPPVGHYFDSAAVTLETTVASLTGTDLVYDPGSRTKYSNAAIAAVGRVLEVVAETPFPEVLQARVLDPMGMTRSAFEPMGDRMARGEMWTQHGVRFPAPTFELGMTPAGSMYSTVEDLGRFMSVLFAGGRGREGQILTPESLEAMWAPQGRVGGGAGYGLGFRLFDVEGHRAVGHGGAIYGFSTELQALPDEGLGVVIVSSLDGSGEVVSRLAGFALRMMLAAREGRTLPQASVRESLPADLARRLDGLFGPDEAGVRLRERNGSLVLTPLAGGGSYHLSMTREEGLPSSGPALVTDDVHGAGELLGYDPGGDWVLWRNRLLDRVPDALPPPPPADLVSLIGEYGWDYNVLYIYEDRGRLRALIEWFFDYPLEAAGTDRFRFPDFGLYHGEGIAFERDASGAVTAAVAAGIRFPRRVVGTAEGITFRIDPVRPVEELRQAALNATPPSEDGEFRDSELVEVASLDASIRLDIRYASRNNFMGAVFYDEARAFLQRPAAEGVVAAHRALAELGLGILIHDGYRPWYVTRMFWDATPEAQKVFVANPASGSRHNRGSAVDLTLFELDTGRPVRTVGGYDEFSARSYPEYPGGTERQRWAREALRDAMESQGFTVYEAEWWHFDHGDWRSYAIQNARFSEIPGSGSR